MITKIKVLDRNSFNTLAQFKDIAHVSPFAFKYKRWSLISIHDNDPFKSEDIEVFKSIGMRDVISLSFTDIGLNNFKQFIDIFVDELLKNNTNSTINVSEVMKSDSIPILNKKFYDGDFNYLDVKYQKFKFCSKDDIIATVALINLIQEDKEDSTLFIHCYAGISRSGAFAVYLNDYLGLDPDIFIKDNPYLYPNDLITALFEEEFPLKAYPTYDKYMVLMEDQKKNNTIIF